VTRACFPGTFNPPTVAHLAIADAALEQLNVDVVEFIVSETTLGKTDAELPDAGWRVGQLRSLAQESGNRIQARLSPASLLAEIAVGYDWLILGADKWAQIQELRWYGNDPHARDAALESLPAVAVIARPPHTVPNHTKTITIHRDFGEVSSTAVRNGRVDWLAKPKTGEMER
jgi:nicotinic acid mononucleotide adenylyltransferase